MARIAYSCCGEGRGHSSRTLTLTRRLRALGHEVVVFASHAAYRALHPIIGNVVEIPGLVLVYARNKVCIGPTLRTNLATWSAKKTAVGEIERRLREFRPELAITDFEPFLPMVATRLGVPYVSVDHQHVIPGLPLSPPARYWPHWMATLSVVHGTHQGEKANLVTSFFHPEKPHRPHYEYFGPILREEVSGMKPAAGGHVLVYQTSSSFERLPEILASLPFEFRIYAFQREGREGNCVFKPRNHPDFLGDLAGASWVLTNGGYTLISESLHLGKPVLSIPVSGQFEQWINAHYLQKLGFGMSCEEAEFGPILANEFASRLPALRAALRNRPAEGTEPILQRILSFV